VRVVRVVRVVLVERFSGGWVGGDVRC
jgi:hypothetical protein